MIGIAGASIDPAEHRIAALFIRTPSAAKFIQILADDPEYLLRQPMFIGPTVGAGIDWFGYFDPNDDSGVDLKSLGNNHAVTPLQADWNYRHACSQR